MRTLVLNADYRPVCTMPLSTVDWKEAISLVYQEKADEIAWYDKEVHTVNKTYKVPAIIVLRSMKKPRFKVAYNKYNVKLRDKFKCAYCGDAFHPSELTLDHVLPKSHKGKASWDNMVASCAPCNSNKKNDPNIVPRFKPRKPTYKELLDNHYKYVSFKDVGNEQWKDWIN